MDHPLPWLRFVDASNITGSDLSLDGMKVRNAAMETLGSVEGFIVDNTSMRPYYAVVDSGGWFKSKDFLVPIGHARIDDDRDALVVDIPRERIDRFPGFDRDQFERLTEDDIRRMNDAICEACSDQVYPAGDPLSTMWGRPDYREPDWWSTTASGLGSTSVLSSGDRATLERATIDTTTRSTVAASGTAARGTRDPQVVRQPERDRERQRTSEYDKELVTARQTDTSPYPDGRAQPGDVIGLETGGEQTHIGETSEDENKRRLEAERAARQRK